MNEEICCPNCGEPMLKGFAGAPGIFWRGQDERPLRWKWIWQALPGTVNWWTLRENIAWRCPDCNWLIIDHSKSHPAKKGAAGEN